MKTIRIKLITGLAMLWSFPVQAVNAQLPSGYYVFLGDKLGDQQPKLLYLDPSGQANWQGQTSVTVVRPYVPHTASPTISPSPHSSSGAFEKYDYPTIKFKPKPIASIPGGIGQVSTVYMERYSHTHVGDLHLRLTLFKIAQPSQDHTVALVDKDGIIAVNIRSVSAGDFHRVAGTALFEAQITVRNIHEADYQRVADCTID